MLILDETGKIINRTDKSIDSLKRAQYGHDIKEEIDEMEDIEGFIDNLEEIDNADFDGEDAPAEADLNPDAVEVAVEYAQFKSLFLNTFGPDELQDAFSQIEDFFASKGVNVTLDLAGLDGKEEIPGMESSEQSITTSEVEEK